jgi:hypothetical protein
MALQVPFLTPHPPNGARINSSAVRVNLHPFAVFQNPSRLPDRKPNPQLASTS